MKIAVPKRDDGTWAFGAVTMVKWTFYKDRNGNGKCDDGDAIVDRGCSEGPNFEQSFLLGNLTVNRASDNQRLKYEVVGEKTKLDRDTALGGVL